MIPFFLNTVSSTDIYLFVLFPFPNRSLSLQSFFSLYTTLHLSTLRYYSTTPLHFSFLHIALEIILNLYHYSHLTMPMTYNLAVMQCLGTRFRLFRPYNCEKITTIETSDRLFTISCCVVLKNAEKKIICMGSISTHSCAETDENASLGVAFREGEDILRWMF